MLRNGCGCNCPYYEQYKPLGTLKSLYTLKVDKIIPGQKPPSPPPETPKIEPLEDDTALSPKRPIKITDTGYNEINKTVSESNSILKYVRSGKPYFNYLSTSSVEEKMEWAGNQIERNTNSRRNTDDDHEIDHIEKLKRKFRIIDKKYNPVPPPTINTNLSPRNHRISILYPSFTPRKSIFPIRTSTIQQQQLERINSNFGSEFNFNNYNNSSNSQFTSPKQSPRQSIIYNNNVYCSPRRPHLPSYVLKSTIPKTSNAFNNITLEPINENKKDNNKDDENDENNNVKSIIEFPSNNSELDPLFELKSVCNIINESKSKVKKNLMNKLSRYEFYRHEMIMNKFECFGKYKNRTLDVDMKRMRIEAEEKSLKIRMERLRNCDWFLLLLDKSQQFNQQLSVSVKRFLVSIQEIIENGEEFTKELFYKIHLDILDDDDHKDSELERLIEYVRKEVLDLNIIEYYNFLKKNKYQIPKTLEKDIEDWTYFEQSKAARLKSE